MTLTTRYFIILLCLTGCKPAAEPIQYGEDNCSYCTMTIVDHRFGCEIVTKKGKVFKFDAVECMVNYINTQGISNENLYLVLTNSYNRPGELIDAWGCYFLKSDELPSPMGMNINPFTDSLSAVNSMTTYPGKILRFKDLKDIVTTQ